MFDTHCHLQFQAFDPTSPFGLRGAGGKVEEIIKQAKEAGVTQIMIPATDVETSKKAVEIAGRFDNIFAAVGIHPHHVFELQSKNSNVKSKNHNLKLKSEIKEIEVLLKNEKVVAVGEVGIDRYYYRKTKHKDYEITSEFIELQKEVLGKQIKLAIKYKKSLILHNREAVNDFLEVVSEVWDDSLSGKTVFHCCEPDEKLLEFAKKHSIFIGVDGDVTYSKKKQEFIKKVPLEMLVLETDSPFLIPEPFKSKGIFPNTPANLKIIAEFLTELHSTSTIQIIKTTTENAQKLFLTNV